MSRPPAATLQALARTALAVLVALGLAPLAPAAASSAGSPPVSSGSAATSLVPRAGEAAAALTRVRRLVAGDGAERSAAPADLTLALRDLALARPGLGRGQLAEADAYLARPTDGPDDELGDGYSVPEADPVCSSTLCIHYVTTSRDRVASADADHDGVPDYVELVLRTVDGVEQTYVDAGYRPPEADGGRGGDDRTDVYLTNLGDQGYYGYCSSDETPPRTGPRDVSAFCVLDNDYTEATFAAHTPVENLQVTAAHEFFHAIQFGYDYTEDGWLMEATATWAEDELFDGVDDNLQYLADSPITEPRYSMDEFGGPFHYGVWIFFRFLTEKRPEADHDLPTLVRDIWRRADSTAGAPDDYSLAAVAHELAARDWSLARAFAAFSAANRDPAASYEEGARNHYPHAPAESVVRLSRAHPRWSRLTTMNHLTSATYALRPGELGPRARLRLSFDLERRALGSAVVVTVVPRQGARTSTYLTLDKQGDAQTVRAFSPRSVRAVEVTLVHAGNDYRCGRHTAFSCGGQARNDGLRQRLTARVV